MGSDGLRDDSPELDAIEEKECRARAKDHERVKQALQKVQERIEAHQRRHERSYELGQQAMAMLLLGEIQKYLPDSEQELVRLQRQAIETRIALKEVFEMLEAEDEFSLDLHPADLCARLRRVLQDEE